MMCFVCNVMRPRPGTWEPYLGFSTCIGILSAGRAGALAWGAYRLSPYMKVTPFVISPIAPYAETTYSSMYVWDNSGYPALTSA